MGKETSVGSGFMWASNDVLLTGAGEPLALPGREETGDMESRAANTLRGCFPI